MRFKNAKGAIATASIICRSQNPGADGTDLTQAPVADAGKLRCAASWNDILVATKREQTQ
ncbi:MAG: hypothetical protein HC778_06635 [Chamaesiphon sp. CSU_1_12]|nr:hypothetical protein [Chamaesiphon sp. CSU_1_12]